MEEDFIESWDNELSRATVLFDLGEKEVGVAALPVGIDLTWLQA